jgi:hypothetical protein
MFGKVIVGMATAGVLAGVVATGAMAAPAPTTAAAPAPKQQAAAKDVFGGVVTAINETQLTVKNAKAGSKTFLRTSSTIVIKGRDQKSSWSEIEVNSHVRVRYEEKSGKLYARRIHIGREHVAGTVQSVNAKQIVLRTRDGKEVRLTIDSNTKYVKVTGKRQHENGSFSDIHAGMRIRAAGSYDSSHNFDAAVIAYRAQ